MIPSIIIEDEARSIRVLKKLLSEYCPDIEIVATANNIHKGMDLINQHKPELLFLDIEMPRGNAFDLLDKLGPGNFEIIFITAFNEYALKAIKHGALDYLLKPISIDDLTAAVNKAQKRIIIKRDDLQNVKLLQQLNKQNPLSKKITIPSKENIFFILLDDILRCEASGAYTFIFTKENGKILSSKNIKEYETILPESIFFRIHHSHIVNLNEIKKYHIGRGGRVELKNGSMVEVSVRRKKDLLARIK